MALVRDLPLFAEGLLPPSSAEQCRGVVESELLRACRLVADASLNTLGWSLEEAVAYLQAHTRISRTDAE